MGVSEHVVAGLPLPELVGGVGLLRRGGRARREKGAYGEGEEGTHLRVHWAALVTRPRRGGGDGEGGSRLVSARERGRGRGEWSESERAAQERTGSEPLAGMEC